MLLPWLLLSLLLPCAPEKQPCDFQEPTFISQDLKNILTWRAPEKLEGLTYSVAYLNYGTEIWHTIPECTNITHTWCDLTKETSDYEEYYYANVTINSQHCSYITKRFSPLEETKISPPTINLFLSDTFMEIKLTTPINISAENLKYRIYLNGKQISKEDPYYKIEHLEPNTTYCVTAAVDWSYRKSHLSNQTCVSINTVYISHETLVIVCVIPVLVVILSVISLACIIYTYVYVKNIQQPGNLDITASNNEHVALVEAHVVTINFISIDGNLEYTKITEKEEEDSKNQCDVQLTDSDKHISLDSGITDTDEGSDDYHGYKSLQEEITPASPIISPYDMPHYPQRTVRPLETTSDIVNEGTIYGCIKCNSIQNQSMPEKEDMYVLQNGCTSEKLLAENTYLPHGTSNFAVQDNVKEEPLVLEELCTDQISDIRIDFMESTDLEESSMLFVDWSPDNPHFYMPNLSKNKELEQCMQDCKEENEMFLHQVNVMEMSEDDELGQLQERWGLCLQDNEI